MRLPFNRLVKLARPSPPPPSRQDRWYSPSLPVIRDGLDMPAHRPRLGIDVLDDRCLPTMFGIPWADPSHLTISFVQDGIATPYGPSSLYSTLGEAAPTASWQRDVLRAFQTWAVNSNIDIGLVADGGQPLGAAGAVQLDSRFGDVRVAAAALSESMLGSGAPFSWSGTTLSGDMVFNARVRLWHRARPVAVRHLLSRTPRSRPRLRSGPLGRARPGDGRNLHISPDPERR